MNLNTVLAMVTPPAGFIADNLALPDEQVAVARDRLRKIMQSRDAAAIVVTEAEAALERVQQLIHAADDAAANLQTAEENSADFTRQWAESGAPSNIPSVNAKLHAAVEAATKSANKARTAAQGAEAGRATVEVMLADAQNTLSNSEGAIRECVTALLSAMIEGHFMQAQKAAADFDEAAHEIQACARALAGNWRDFSSNSAATAILTRLQAAMPSAPVASTNLLPKLPELSERSKEFVALGERLLKNANAK